MQNPIQSFVEIAEEQLRAFKKFQDKEYKGMTIRDFDVWLGGYISGLSRLINHYFKPKSEQELEKILREIAETIVKGKTAESLGVKSTEKDLIETFNIAQK